MYAPGEKRERVFTNYYEVHTQETLMNSRNNGRIIEDPDKPIDLTRGASLVRRDFRYQNMNFDRNGASAPRNVTLKYSSEGLSNNPSGNHSGTNNVAEDENGGNSNQMEIIRAAKALFSKKTRTLYHWMYPNTPKMQLKSAVSVAWDTLGVQEKQFYIAQVLGKFGCLQSRLMINPQLGCLSSSTSSSSSYPQLVAGNNGGGIAEHMDLSISNLETRNAVSNLLQQNNNNDHHNHVVECPNQFLWHSDDVQMQRQQQLQQPATDPLAPPPPTVIRKRGRPKGSTNTSSALNRMTGGVGGIGMDHHQQRMMDERMRCKLRKMHKKYEKYDHQRTTLTNLKSAQSSTSGYQHQHHHHHQGGSSVVTGVPMMDEFKDDPELHKEFEKFQWAMHMADNNK